MLKRKIAISLTASTVFAVSGFSSSVLAATAATSASVDIVQAISVTKVADPDFGVVIPTATAGTVVLSPDGSVVATNVSHQAGTEVVGSFTVSGTNNQAYVITDPGTIILSGTLDVDTWTVTNANGDCANIDIASCSPSLSGTGGDTLSLGGTLNVPASQAQGQYTTNFSLEVLYQ